LGNIHLVTHTGREGRLWAASLMPNLILLDVQMSSCDAFEILVDLGRAPTTGAIPVGVLSGDQEERIRFLRAGAAAWITKPLTINDVARTMIAMIELFSTR